MDVLAQELRAHLVRRNPLSPEQELSTRAFNSPFVNAPFSLPKGLQLLVTTRPRLMLEIKGITECRGAKHNMRRFTIEYEDTSGVMHTETIEVYPGEKISDKLSHIILLAHKITEHKDINQG